MGFPSLLQDRIEKRFEGLARETEQVLTLMDVEKAEWDRQLQNQGVIWAQEYTLASEQFYSLQTKCLSLIQLLSRGNTHLMNIYADVKALENKKSHLERMRGQILGLLDDFKSGMLDSLSDMIEANVISDYLGQAEHLLTEGKSGNYDHVPAAVLTGAILEDALRRLCQRQNPLIPVNKPNGEPKTLNPIIDDLRKADVFNELKAKQLRSWADIRNAAAHGKFDEFNRQDVEQMLTGVQNFLADYL